MAHLAGSLVVSRLHYLKVDPGAPDIFPRRLGSRAAGVQIATLGSATTDPIIAPLLIELADRLLTHLGFPPERRADSGPF